MVDCFGANFYKSNSFTIKSVFPHSQASIKEGKKKFNSECKEVISEELTLHMKSLSLTWQRQSFTLEQQR